MAQTNSINFYSKVKHVFPLSETKSELNIQFLPGKKKFLFQHMNSFHVNNKKLIQFSVIDCISLGILLLPPLNFGEESPR